LAWGEENKMIENMESHSLKSAEQVADRIDGWLWEEEGKLLYNLAKKNKAGAIIEIGSWKGKSTVYLGMGSMVGGKASVYAIDPHSGTLEHQRNDSISTLNEFKENIEKAALKDIVCPIVKTSKEASINWQKPVGFIFIDGGHEYEFVEEDFRLWFPFVINGGIMAFHDSSNWDGPRRVVEKYVYQSGLFKNIRLVGSITYAVKTNKLSKMDKIRNKRSFFKRKI